MLLVNSEIEKMQNPRYTAIFVDYENVCYHLRNKYADIPELSDFVVELLMNLQKHLEETFGLRKLSDVLPNLADWQRKGLISDLENKGAVRMEKRNRIQFNYTVVILNYNHPVVREMC